jgi:serine O-acetyltransferase
MDDSMSLEQVIRYIAWDLRVNKGPRWDNVRAMLLLVEFRLEQYVYRRMGRPGHPLRLLWYACRFAGSVYQCLLCGSNLPGTATIGPGLRLPHPQGIIIAGTTEMGAFCTVYQGVSVAWSGFHPTVPGLPEIGDCVLLGAGAIVLGEVTIGPYVLVGAGTTVTHSVPDYARVTGPAPTVAPRVPSVAAATPGSERHLRDPYSIWR